MLCIEESSGLIFDLTKMFLAFIGGMKDLDEI